MGEPIGTGAPVGLVHGEDTGTGLAEDVESALADTDVTSVGGDPETVLAADPAVVLGVGDEAVTAIADRDPTVPILPVDADRGLGSIDAAAIPDALSALESGDWKRVSHPVLEVTVGDERRGVALLDVLLVTDGPARISAFEVRADGEVLTRVRADGVLVATPAGTATYARAAGGPAVRTGTDALAVVTIAPFSTSRDRYVVPAASVTLRATREDEALDLIADGDVQATVAADRPVRVAPRGTIETVRCPASPDYFD